MDTMDSTEDATTVEMWRMGDDHERPWRADDAPNDHGMYMLWSASSALISQRPTREELMRLIALAEEQDTHDFIDDALDRLRGKFGEVLLQPVLAATDIDEAKLALCRVLRDAKIADPTGFLKFCGIEI